jgi:hypothetical protein
VQTRYKNILEIKNIESKFYANGSLNDDLENGL